MTKNKKGKKSARKQSVNGPKTRPKQQKAKKMQMSGSKAIAHRKHHRDVCSITDPFCIHARAARRPDGLSQNTIPYTVRGMVGVTTDSNGNAYVVVTPNFGRYWGAQASWVSGTSTFDLPAVWSATASNAFLSTNAAEIRIVSAGCVVTNIASMTTCQGTLHTGVLAYSVPSQQCPLLNLNNSEDFVKPMTAGMQQSFIFKPLGTDAHAFRKVSDITNSAAYFDWTSVFIEISGGAINTPTLTIEYVFNIEIQLTQAGVSTTGLASAISNAKPANQIALTAQNTVHSTIPSMIAGGVEAVEKKISAAASNALDYLLSSAEDFGLGLLGL